jgi:hypothetical protein
VNLATDEAAGPHFNATCEAVGTGREQLGASEEREWVRAIARCECLAVQSIKRRGE